MQYPVEVPGVSVSNFLRTAKTAIDGEAPKLRTWVKDVNATLDALNLDASFGQRSVNEGFSGGEKKRHEIAQMELLDPGMAILDETDSGLDIDALKIVADGVNRFRAHQGKVRPADHPLHRILRYIQPDFVHVFVAGRIADEGGPSAPRSWRRAATTSTSRLQSPLVEERALTRVTKPRKPKGDLMKVSPRPRRHPQGLPDPGADGRGRPRQCLASGLPRLGEHQPEAAGGHRHDGRPPRAPQRQHCASDAHAGRRVEEAFEAARDKVAAFIGAPEREGVVFTKNITEALNLLANTFAWADGDLRVGPGDEVVITEMEHHSNIVPWQLLTERTGATLRWFDQVPAARHVQAERDLVGHRAGGHVQGRFLVRDVGCEVLQGVDRGVVPVPGVPDLGVRHRTTHLR